MASTGFFKSSHFAVVGASSNPAKFGSKVLTWYISKNLSVSPINPNQKFIQGLPSLPSLASLDSPKTTSLSIITPPPITLELLKQATSEPLDVPYIWLQPGAEDARVTEFISANHLDHRVIWGGPCILIDGQSFLLASRNPAKF